MVWKDRKHTRRWIRVRELDPEWLNDLRIKNKKSVKLVTNLWLTFVNTFAAIGSPVVVAIIVYGSFTVEEKAISAGFQCQRSVSAFVILVTVFRVGIKLKAFRFWTGADVLIWWWLAGNTGIATYEANCFKIMTDFVEDKQFLFCLG